ncbi:MFS transporter [Rhodococcus sp. WMMA185]|uniref:MFS transporter n=1 Tax=Rhodococcus sp. WMMA185 TaxID=679318 RepID=UPI0008785AC1|nr:MFS transporter [Rhodococcus sp. WMMA185]AOW92059.1 MFS transporter [Rhodococcus sp. WMMA185]
MSASVAGVQSRPGPQRSPSTPRRVAAGAAIGQVVEWYDYGIYGFLAVPIAYTFFSSSDPTAALLATFAVFAVPFVARPFGGVLCGYLADRIGRQRVLVGVLLLISLATVGIGVLPGYTSIGIAGPIILVLFRLMQGLSAGGEVVSAMSFVAEHAPPGRRAFLMCWGQSGAFIALFAGNIAGLTLAATLTENQINEWGWRIPFLLALPLALIGLYMRRHLDESPAFREIQEQRREEKPEPLRAALAAKTTRRAIVLCAALALLNSSGYYALFTYMPTYLMVNLDYSQQQAFGATALAIMVMLLVIPIGAITSDRIGRRPVLLFSSILVMIIAIPSFALLDKGIGFLIIGLVVLGVTFAAYTGTIHAALAELFPTRIRVTAYAIGYNFSTAVFGGAAPLMLVFAIDRTGISMFPAFYLIATALGTAIAAWRMKETSEISMTKEVSQ